MGTIATGVPKAQKFLSIEITGAFYRSKQGKNLQASFFVSE